MSARTSDRAANKKDAALVTAGRHRSDQPARRPFCPIPPGPGTAQSTAPALAAAGQRQPDGLASSAALPAQAAAITACWQSGKDASCLIRQVKAELALKKADGARCGRPGDLAPAAGLDLRLDAAANALGDLQVGQRMLKQEAGTEEAATAWRRLVPAGGQPATRTFSAWGPFWPWVMSNSTFCPSSRLR
jgi:hypothetical protein